MALPLAAYPDLVRPVLIDPPTRRFLMHPATLGRRTWTVPTVPVRLQETYADAAVLHLRRHLRLPPLRIAPVVGRIPPAGPDGHQEFLVLIAPTTTWPHRAHRRVHPEARWWTLTQIRATNVPVEPVSLIDLIDGYWDGWLPDGMITLDR